MNSGSLFWKHTLLLTLTVIVFIAQSNAYREFQSKIKVDSEGPRQPFIDEFGRVRVFHGLNRVNKGFPWYPSQLLDETHLDNLAAWGFNVVRLGMMWSGVETAPFTVNQTYLSVMETIIQSLAKRGIYVIFDMHQDVLSSKFDSYDGAPLWLVDSFPPPKHQFPWPFSKKPSSWGLLYVTEACSAAFQDLYTNQSQALDHWAFFWQTVAKRFGHYYNVLGYELINEPWPGNVFADPLLFLPGKTGKDVFEPLYDSLFDAINRVDNETLIFYEPTTWGMIFHGGSFGSGFSHVPGGDNYKNRGVLSFHYYCWFAGTYNQSPLPWWLKELCNKLFFPDVLNTVMKDIGDTGGSAFLTEFGLCQGAAPHNSTEYQECLSVLSTSDKEFVSWTYWDSLFYYGNGSINVDNVKLFSRTYAQAVAGDPKISSFDSNTGSYYLQYDVNKAITQPTVIYASPIHYPKGFKVETNASYKTNGHEIQVSAQSASTQTIEVRVSRL